MEKVCVVHTYKHQGVWLTSDGSLTIEMKHRAATACGALVALERTVLGKKGCSWEMQCQFVQTLVLSRLLCKAHVWTLRHKDTALLHRPYLRALRRIGGALAGNRMRQPRPITDSEVRRRLGAPSVECLLIKARLQYLGRGVQGETQLPNVVGHPGQEVWKCTKRHGGGHARPPLGVQQLRADMTSIVGFVIDGKAVPTVS